MRSVLIVGAGAIGASWARLLLGLGLEVTVVDPATRQRERLLDDLRRQLDDDADGLDGLTMSHDLAVAEECDFVLEAIPERMSLKHSVFSVLDAVCSPDVVLSSSTSSLPASAIAEACAGYPERVVVAHPFNPPHIMPLVEVVGGASTSQEVVAATMATMRAWGKNPIHLRREVPGHVANRLQAALWREAYNLVVTGVATAADVDQAMASGPGLRWALLGPFLTQHLSGGPGGFAHIMEHLGPSTFALWEDLGHPTMTPGQQARLTDSVRDELASIQSDDLAQRRDSALRDLLRLKQTHHLDTTA